MLKHNLKIGLPGTHNVQRIRLKNGLTVLVYENHNVQSVVLTGSLRAGAIYETPEQGGLASMTAEALRRGTQNHLRADQQCVGRSRRGPGFQYGQIQSGFQR